MSQENSTGTSNNTSGEPTSEAGHTTQDSVDSSHAGTDQEREVHDELWSSRLITGCISRWIAIDFQGIYHNYNYRWAQNTRHYFFSSANIGFLVIYMKGRFLQRAILLAHEVPVLHLRAYFCNIYLFSLASMAAEGQCFFNWWIMLPPQNRGWYLVVS